MNQPKHKVVPASNMTATALFVVIGAEHVDPSKIITVRGNIGSDTCHHLSWDDKQRGGIHKAISGYIETSDILYGVK